MKNTSDRRPTADEIADMADAGEDIERFFTGEFTVVRAGRKESITIQLPHSLVDQLDHTAKEVKLTRQEVLETMLREYRDQHHLTAA